MRIVLVVFIALLFQPFQNGAAQAAEEESPMTRVHDPAGDVREIGPTTNQSNNGENPDADITEVWIGNETLETVEFGIRFKEVQAPDDTLSLPLVPLVGVQLTAGFTINWKLGEASFAIEAGGSMTNCGGSAYAFRRYTERSSSVSCGGFQPEVDPTGQSLRFTIPRERLLNETDVPFGPGTDITDLFATAIVPVTPGPAGSRAEDRAPDEGFGPAYHSTLAGEAGSGSILMTSAEPVRVSNGESTTLVYPVDITNLGDAARVFHLSSITNMSDWQIRVPARLQLEPQEKVTFPVILSMGFTHDHGGLTTFDVRAQDAADMEEWAKITLGVFWLDTPQPAGHHDSLWLHSGGGGSYGVGTLSHCDTAQTWFNPLETEDKGFATEEDAAGCDFNLRTSGTPSDYADGQTFTWAIPLDPPLAIGLDFDLSRPGTFVTGLRAKLASSAATLRMELLYCDTTQEPDDRPIYFERCSGRWVPLADAALTKAVAANSVTDYAFEFTPTPEADFVPFRRDSNLLVFLTLHTPEPMTPPGQSSTEYGPMLVIKGSKLTLPLIEYHDPIDQAFQNIGTLELRALGPFEKAVNGGRRSLFPFDLTNRGSQEQTIDIQIEGHNKGWANILGSRHLELGPGEKRNFSVLVEAPADAAPGERAELFLVAQSDTDPNLVAIARLRSAVVDAALQDVPDEDPSTVAGGGEGVPGLGVLAFAMTLSVISMLRRRRT